MNYIFITHNWKLIFTLIKTILNNKSRTKLRKVDFSKSNKKINKQ